MIYNVYLEDRPNKKGEKPIRISVSVLKTRLSTNIGISLKESDWDDKKQRMRPHRTTSKGQTSAEINETLSDIETKFTIFEKGCEEKPTLDEMKNVLKGKGEKKVKPVRLNVLNYYDQFINEESIASQWSEGTLQTIRAFRHHLEAQGKNLQITWFNDDGINKMMRYFRTDCNLQEVSIQKYYKIIRWFLNWCIRKKLIDQGQVFNSRPKMKLIEQPIIFLTKEELLKLYNFEVPANGTKVSLRDINGFEYEKVVSDSSALNKTKDLFCFCAFTSLRYSDMAKVKRTDIVGDILYTTTQKTNDRLPINLNSFAKEILAKYEKETFPGGLALPVISNQKMNDYLKDLCEICGFDEPVTKSFVQGGQRVNETRMKWELMGTHAGRRTFICFALANGIPPQVVMKWTGHSDYKAMKPYIEIAEKTKADAMALFEMGLKG